jgi:hypothetical protein
MSIAESKPKGPRAQRSRALYQSRSRLEGVLSLIGGFTLMSDLDRIMTPKLTEISRQRESLYRELFQIRQMSLSASRRDDYRTVARLTLETARVHRAIEETDLKLEAA